MPMRCPSNFAAITAITMKPITIKPVDRLSVTWYVYGVIIWFWCMWLYSNNRTRMMAAGFCYFGFGVCVCVCVCVRGCGGVGGVVCVCVCVGRGGGGGGGGVGGAPKYTISRNHNRSANMILTTIRIKWPCNYGRSGGVKSQTYLFFECFMTILLKYYKVHV